jgi:ubiquinone/menaquinone biosynthesis C-methylase UbiE
VRTLRRWEQGEPRLYTKDHFASISSSYEEAGVAEPTMTDYEVMAGFSSKPDWQTDLRYRRVIREYTGGKVADVGCGDGRLCWRYGICDPAEYYGVDVARDLLRVLREKTGEASHAVEAAAEDTQLPADSFDLVVCTEAFEHLSEPGSALREYARIAKEGGTVLIQSPSATRLRNINPFHVLATILGRAFPAILLRTVVHEHTFVRAYTYHWDFTKQDFEMFCQGLPLRLESIGGSMYRFDPERGLLHKILSRLADLPFINLFWWDLTVVLRKTG